jgi:hypothetical protein
MRPWPVLLLTACPSAQPPVNTCLPDIQAQIADSATCSEAQIRVDVLLRYSKSCRDIFADAGLDVCAKVKDASHEH